MSAAAEAGTGRWPSLAVLGLAMLLPSLGTSIANVALPTLAAHFDVPMAGAQWIVISYLLAMTSFIVGAGRLGDQLGKSRMLSAGIAVFAVASAAAAISPSLPFLVAARIAQGAGAAVLMALSIAMVGDIVPPHKAGTAMGWLGTISAAGTALGPSLGGLLLATVGWHAIFLLLALLGGVAWVLQRAFPSDSVPQASVGSYDGTGMVLLAASLAAVSAAATLCGKVPVQLVLGLAVLALLGLAGFVLHELRTSVPLVQLGLLKQPKLSSGLYSMMAISAVVMTTLVVGPFYLTEHLHLTPGQTGLVMSLGPVIAALAGAPAGKLVDSIGASRVLFIGLGTALAGSVLMGILPQRLGLTGYAASLALITLGYAVFQAANTTRLMHNVDKAHRGVTSALLGLSRNLGLISGASVMGAVYAAGPAIALPWTLATDHSGLAIVFLVAAAVVATALAASFIAKD